MAPHQPRESGGDALMRQPTAALAGATQRDIQVRSGVSRPFLRFGRPCRTRSPQACGMDLVATRKRCSTGRGTTNDVTDLRIVAAMLDCGCCATRDEAKAKFAETWRVWLALNRATATGS